MTTSTKTLQAADGFFNFIFKIGEALFYYIVILFEIIGQIGNFGIKNFLVYIVGFFATIVWVIEKIFSALFAPFKKTVNTIWKFIYKLFGRVLQTFFTETSALTQYITGFVVFLSIAVYYFLYRKNEDEAATEGKTAQALKILEGFEFGAIWGTIWRFFARTFKTAAIVVYSLFIGLLSMELYTTMKDSYNWILNKSKEHEDNKFVSNMIFYFGLLFVFLPMTIYGWLSKFVFAFFAMYREKMRNFDAPILDESRGGVSAFLYKIFNFIAKIAAFFKYYFDIVYNHFAAVRKMSWLSYMYVILSGFVYIGLLYKLYFWGGDAITAAAGENHLYYYLIASYLFFIGPLIYLLLKLPQQSLNGLILVSVAFISMLVMYVSNYYMNYRKSVGMEETPEQESDRNTYNILFVIYSAIIVFFVNFKILSPEFNQSSILLYTLLNLCFICALIGYSVSYKIKLTNRLNKAAVKTPTPPPKTENGVLTTDMTTPDGAATRF